MSAHCHVGVCSSPDHCKEIGQCFSTPAARTVDRASRAGDQEALHTIAEFPVTHPSNMDAHNMREIARAALAAQAPQAAEQVACPHEAYQGRCVHCDAPFVNGRAVIAPQAPAAQPLTEDEIVKAIKGVDEVDHTQPGWFWRRRIAWGRAIERAVWAKCGIAPSAQGEQQ